MALTARKGFIHTLEAIIASTHVLGVVLTVIPEFQQLSDTRPQEQVRSGLEALDNTGDLTDNLSSNEIESEIESYVPSAYNYSVNIVEVNSASGTDPSLPRYINTTGSYSEVQLWIKSSNGLNISFGDETLLESSSDNGYKAFSVSDSEGWLNTTGTGEFEYRFDTYNSDTENIDQKRVSVVNYITTKNGTKEIRVRLWE
jgi:hypothetical protein